MNNKSIAMYSHIALNKINKKPFIPIGNEKIITPIFNATLWDNELRYFKYVFSSSIDSIINNFNKLNEKT